MITQRFKLLLITFSLILSACVSGPSADKYNQAENLVPPPNQAINMRDSQKTSDAYSLYGIKLGEDKASVEDKYKMVSCRKSVYFFRCLVFLDTHDVTGISLSDSATIFVTFKDDVVYSMTIPVSGASLNQVSERFVMIYGEPVSLSVNRATWSNDSGSVVLEQRGDDTQNFSVIYTRNL